MAEEPEYSGGCQCGKIRFHVKGRLVDSSICHCRMCQKAYGNVFAAIVSTNGAQLTWTRAEPKYFRSSNHVLRGFCENCGTPLAYQAPDGIGLSVGAFDEPHRLPPTVQFGIEGKIAWFDGLHELPARRTEDDAKAAPFMLDIVSSQHPDQDTPDWPEEKS